MVIRQIILILLILTPLYSLTALAKVSATVDRAIVEKGETFTLTIISDDESPELDVLEKDFHVLGTSQSSKISFVNGSISKEKEWIVNLSPKKSGSSLIPAFKMGNESTKAIRIRVVKSTAVSAAQGADIFLEVVLDTNTAYVQSEVIYTAKLFRAVEIREGSLTEPEIQAAVVERMGEDVTYQTTRNQRRYYVTERSFALFPQKSGSLAIPPTVFDGQVVVPRKANQPGSANDPFDRFFQSQPRMKRVRVKSDAMALDVLPQPVGFKGENWLPVKRLVLSESWSVEPPVFKVGEPITRTLKIQAVGQTGAQLPEFKIVPADGIKQYIDQPKVDTGLLEGSLVGIREEKFAIIPTKSGELELPEIRLYWWDTELDSEQVVTIAARQINVAPEEVSENSAVVEPKVELSQPDATETQITITEPELKALLTANYWPFIALALGLGWVLTLIAWIMQVKRRKPSQMLASVTSTIDAASLNVAKKELHAACNRNDANAAKIAMLAWANAAWPAETKTRSLIAVGERLHNDEALQAVSDLDEVLYSNGITAWNGNKFWSVVGEQLKKPRHKNQSKLKSLPELYPE